jgi:pSer/pThr/pTyr-binding forkhead associated (FHA) protein
MNVCLQCGTEIRLGALCLPHAEAISTCSDMTAEQIVSRDLNEPASGLIDQWGNTHALQERSRIGRLASECAVAILHHSVSAVHAEIELVGRDAGNWRVIDRGSLNGTFVEDEQVRNAPLHHGERVRFGNVSFYFSGRRLAIQQARTGASQTVPTRARDIAFQVRVASMQGSEMALVQRASGGIMRIDEDTALEFARLEFALLKILTERRLMHSDPELAFVSSQELADLLDFKSQEADGENVRELVRRVRRKFKAEGIEDLIESRQGVGYRLAWTVKGQP